MPVVIIEPDVYLTGDDQIFYIGPQWLSRFANEFITGTTSADSHVVIRSPRITFASQYEWVSFLAAVETILSKPTVTTVQVDFTDPMLSILEATSRRSSVVSVGASEIEYSKRLLRVVRYLDNIGTLAVLNTPRRSSRFFFTGIAPAMLAAAPIHAKSDYSTTIFGVTRIESKDACRQFLDPSLILRWKVNMGEKYQGSPLFHFDEIWRVLCHELAVNTWEHAGTAGFLSARIVTPSVNGQVRPYTHMSFSREVVPALIEMGDSLELCIADAGRGIVATLGDAYRSRTGRDPVTHAKDVLAFAFDEVGTSKTDGESWATQRHALGRILSIIDKYSGLLVLESGGAEVTYIGSAIRRRIPNHLGFVPDGIRSASATMPGTRLRVILPLEPVLRPPRPKTRSVLLSSLPTSFSIDHSQVRGHIVPIKETLGLTESGIGRDEQRQFRVACEQLCRRLINARPAGEPLTFDCHELDWTAAQFETFLYLLQNVIQTRPTLFTQLKRELALEVLRLEDAGSGTLLNADAVISGSSRVAQSYGELSESRFLGTYHDVHYLVLALDVDGVPYLFGAPTDECRAILMQLIEGTPLSPAEIESRSQHQMSALRAVLTPTSQLFEFHETKWRCVWSNAELQNQALRSMQINFDEVVNVTRAWRGRRPDDHQGTEALRGGRGRLIIGRDTGKEKFSLPWQDDDAWVSEFLESSRILTRGRYLDEAAQLMLYRLVEFLRSRDRTLADVHALAAITAPALQLAAALHRWWPGENGRHRPTIFDCGYSMLLHPGAQPPVLDRSGGIIIVQDVLSAGIMSRRLIRWLRKQRVEILGLLALVRLVEQGVTHASPILDWPDREGVPSHAMIAMRRPPRTAAPPTKDSGDRSFWIEPRSLRPFQYSMLRGSKDPRIRPPHDGDSANPYETSSGCIVRSGHFVVGNRHHSLSLDIAGVLQESVGTRLADWLADICQGFDGRAKPEWETQRGYEKFCGDVSIVLMPLNSQIHYLWPLLEELLAQRGRRQPFFLLDATLFLGSGPVYHFPLQFTQQLYDAVSLLASARTSVDESHFHPLRILILDDAIASGRTALTIIDALQRAIGRAMTDYGLTPPIDKGPVEWVRYFAVFNRMTASNYQHWRSLRSIDSDAVSIPFVFEDYLRCIGFPQPEEGSCEQCLDLKALHSLLQHSHAGDEPARAWIRDFVDELTPRTLEHSLRRSSVPRRLTAKIDVLPPISLGSGTEVRYDAHYADSAIAVFDELMYRSFPPDDVFRSLATHQVILPGTGDESEHERYRWAVLDWAIRNWPRVIAYGGRSSFFACAHHEVDLNSGLVGRLFYGVASLYSDSDRRIPHDFPDDSAEPLLQQFVQSSIDALVRLSNADKDGRVQPRNYGRALTLSTALHLFFLRTTTEIPGVMNDTPVGDLLVYLEKAVREAEEGIAGFPLILRNRFWGGGGGSHGVAWALYTIAEALFRAKGDSGPSDHIFLRGWLDRLRLHPNDPQLREFLLCSLGSFLEACETLAHYSALRASLDARGFRRDATLVLKWLVSERAKNRANPAPETVPLMEIARCYDALDKTREISRVFAAILHPTLLEIRESLKKTSAEMAQPVQFDCEVELGSEQLRVLIDRDRLCMTLMNWTVNAAKDYPGGPHKCLVVMGAVPDDVFHRIRFRILTDYATPEEAIERISHGRSWESTTEVFLSPFRVTIGSPEPPCAPYLAMQYTTMCDLLVSPGFGR